MTKLIIHLLHASKLRSYVIDSKNVSKQEFEKHVKDNNLVPVEDKSAFLGTHRIYDYIKNNN